MRFSRHPWTLGLFVLLATSLACATLKVPGLGKATGSFDLPNPAGGLDQLSSYQAILERDFNGTQDNTPSQWSDTWTLTVSRDPQIRLLTLTSQSPDQLFDGAVTGEMAGVTYSRANAQDPCLAVPSAESQASAAVEVAKLLPPFTRAKDAGAETLAGLSVRHYQFDGGALNSDARVTAQGEAWIEAQRGFVVKYSLTVQGDEEYFGQGITGKMSWQYELNQIDQAVEPLPPEGCPFGLVEAPLPDDAAQVVRMPGVTTFTTRLTVPEVAAFFTGRLTGQGWQPVDEPNFGEEYGGMQFAHGSQFLMVSIVKEAETNVTLSLQASEGQPPTAGVTPSGPATSADPSSMISNSLNRTLGIGEQGPVLPSYHLEASGDHPKQFSLSADVEGKNVHLVYTEGGKTTEGYIFEDKEYKLVNGKAVETPGSMKLTWATWPLEPVMALATASTGPAAQGEEDYADRTAEVYALDTAGAPPGILDSVRSFSDISSARGTVWIDKQTGALLKLILDYTPQSGTGHVEIVLTQIGQVTVRIP